MTPLTLTNRLAIWTRCYNADATHHLEYAKVIGAGWQEIASRSDPRISPDAFGVGVLARLWEDTFTIERDAEDQ